MLRSEHMKLTALFFALLGIAYAQPSLTIYNQNFAVVRQDVPLTLQEGETTVSFNAVTSQLEPDSVVFRDPTGALEFQILEQNYRNDPVSQSLLLHQFEGQEIPFLIKPRDGSAYEKEAQIIRSGYVRGGASQSPIIKLDGMIRFGLPGQPLFPSLGADSILRPTLSWALKSTAGEGQAELSYLSKGFSWKSDYNLVITKDSDQSSLNGWITLNNNSGTTFEEAEVQLMAGDVNKVHNLADDPFGGRRSNLSSAKMLREETVTQKEIDSFHLYSVARPVTLRDRETKQVQFIESNQVLASKSYVYEPQRNQRFYGSLNSKVGKLDGFSKDVSIYWSFENTTENGLGIPLPAGKVRLYQEEDQKLEFLGENTIDHTPQKEAVEFYTGNAFDLVGERKVLDFKINGKTMTETIEVKLRNRSKETVTISAHEKLLRWSEWELLKQSAESEKLNSHTIRFQAELAPDEERVINYTVKYSWK